MEPKQTKPLTEYTAQELYLALHFAYPIIFTAARYNRAVRSGYPWSDMAQSAYYWLGWS